MLIYFGISFDFLVKMNEISYLLQFIFIVFWEPTKFVLKICF